MYVSNIDEMRNEIKNQNRIKIMLAVILTTIFWIVILVADNINTENKVTLKDNKKREYTYFVSFQKENGEILSTIIKTTKLFEKDEDLRYLEERYRAGVVNYCQLLDTKIINNKEQKEQKEQTNKRNLEQAQKVRK